jgi:hypothetical protein
VVVVVVELVLVELDDVVVGRVVGAAATVVVVVGSVDVLRGFADGSTASTWLQAATRRQHPIRRAVRDIRTISNLQTAGAGEHVFRRCSSTTHSVDNPRGP